MARERILIGGFQGSGKTTAILSIASLCPQNKVYIIDPDDGVERVWQEEFAGVNNIDLEVTPTWADVDRAYKRFMLSAQEGDWVAVDMLVRLWRLVREHFIAEIWGDEMADYYMRRRQEQQEQGKRAMSLHTPQDWDVINKLYTGMMDTFCYKTKAHFIATTSVSALAQEDDPVLRDYMRSLGQMIRFDGQKDDVYKFHTLLLLSTPSSNVYRMSTLGKDRGRRHVQDMDVVDFASDYLVDIAKWNP